MKKSPNNPATSQRKACRWVARALWEITLALVLAVSLWAILDARPLFAQSVDATVVSAEEPVAAGTSIGPDEINTVARQLWCPLCSGVRLDACELKACAQMKDEIGIMLSEGQEVQLIKETFVARYGPQVLGEPPRSGWSWLAWALPFIVLVAGGIYLYTRARKMVEAPDTATGTTKPPSDYDRKLDDELDQYK